jgi:hypothetical protein
VIDNLSSEGPLTVLVISFESRRIASYVRYDCLEDSSMATHIVISSDDEPVASDMMNAVGMYVSS